MGTWQLLTARTQLRDKQHEVQGLTQLLKQAQSTVKTAKSDLASAQRALNAQDTTSTTTIPSVTAPIPAPFPFVDNTTLLADLNNASENGFGYNLNGDGPAWVNAFVSAFTAEEERETTLAQQGRTYYIPDPISEANAYVANGTLP